jgi:hypothetical protein
MQRYTEERARKMVKELKGDKDYSGFIVKSGIVVKCRSGSVRTDAPTIYDETDLKNAIDLRLLEKRKVSGSVEWEWWALKTYAH